MNQSHINSLVLLAIGATAVYFHFYFIGGLAWFVAICNLWE